MKRLLILILLAACAAKADPLAVGYKPAMDTNCAHAAYASNIWMTDWTVKERQDTGTNPGSACTLTIYGTQNEIVDFQVHFTDGGSGTTGLKVTVGNFVQTSPGSFTIGTTAYDIVPYREGYIQVQGQVTSTASTYYNALGFYPDYLIPPTDPYHGQTTNAWPFTVASGKNQSAWVDVHIPTTALSGYYLASVVVQTGCPGSCVTVATMPVTIAVWQWPSAGFMPSTTTLPAYTGMNFADMCIQAYGSYASCGSWPGASGNTDAGVAFSNIDLCSIMADHRYSGCIPNYPPPTSVFTGFVSSYGPSFTGTAPTILPGAKITTLGYPFGATTTYLQNWITETQSLAWSANYFTYPCDEPPGGCSWATVVTNGTNAHATTPPTPVLVTASIAAVTTNSALSSVDIMTVNVGDMENPTFGNTRSTYNTWLAGNCCGAGSPTRKLWYYNDCVGTGTCGNGTVGPNGGTGTYANYDIDGLPAANRAEEWGVYHVGAKGELYYIVTGGWTLTGGGCCSLSAPNPYVYGAGCATGTSTSCSTYLFGGWGEGTFLYPSRSQGIDYVTASGGGTLTYPIYLPSIRLKLLRDSMQDYEYLNRLNTAGLGSFVTTQLSSWMTNSYTFETTGSGLNTARLALGNQMQALTYSVPAAPTKRGVLLMTSTR